MIIKAIKIDVNHMRVTQIEMKNNLDGIYEALGCYVYSDIELSDSFKTNQHHSLLVDDEGIFGNTHLFKIDDQFFFGNGIIVGFDPLTGGYRDSNIDFALVQSSTEFYIAMPANF